MENKLSKDEINTFCMYMRVIDLMNKNITILNDNPPIKKEYDLMCKAENQIMSTLSEEERDKILEIHKLQLEKIAKIEDRKQARNQKKAKN